jgi:adenylate cyclase
MTPASHPPARTRLRRGSIVLRLLAAFLLVSLLPIGSLAYLAAQETRAEPAAPAGERGAEAGEAHAEAGLPVARLEQWVAAISLALGVAMALYISRTVVRPVRELAAAMRRAEHGDLDSFVPVTSTDEIGQLAEAFNEMLHGLQREALIRDLFGQYVTPEVARVAIEQRGHLDGQLVNCSVLFADIRGFTPLTEKLPPGELIALLNRYFTSMSAAVVEEGGMVNRFGGDSLLAIFGTPVNPAADHALRAVRAALRMRASLAAFNRQQPDKGQPEIKAGIGVATGEIVAGNVGSRQKVEYTVIGDAVNLAARLQALTKEYERDILISAETAGAAASIARLEPICQVTIRGKSAPIDVYAVKGQRGAVIGSPAA